MPPNQPSHPPLVWLALAIVYVVWGSTYLAIAIAVETLPPFLMAAVRFGIAGVLLLAWSALRDGRHFRPPSRQEWRDSTIVGSLLICGGMGLVAWGEQTVPSGITALLVATMPFWLVLIGRVFLDQRLPRVTYAGIAVGLVGVAILVAPTGAPAEHLDLGGTLVIGLSPVLWSIGSLYAAHRAALPARPLVATGAQMVAGSGALLAAGVLTGEPSRVDPAGFAAESLLAVVYLTFVGSVVAFTAYSWLLRAAPLPLVSTYAYVNPVVAVVLGAVILSEPVTPKTLVAGAVILAAVALIISTRSRLTARSRADDPPGTLARREAASATAARTSAAPPATVTTRDPAAAPDG